MNKRIRKLIDNLMYILNSKLLNELAIKAKFLIKDSKFTPEKFISLCVFSNTHLCENSLEELSTWLRVNETLPITKQGVNNRFNKESEDFLRSFFSKLMMSQSKLFSHNEKRLKSIVDAGESDFGHIPKLENNIGKNDLKLKDLGYFKVNHLEYIDKAEAFYTDMVPEPLQKLEQFLLLKQAFKEWLLDHINISNYILLLKKHLQMLLYIIWDAFLTTKYFSHLNVNSQY